MVGVMTVLVLGFVIGGLSIEREQVLYLLMTLRVDAQMNVPRSVVDAVVKLIRKLFHILYVTAVLTWLL